MPELAMVNGVVSGLDEAFVSIDDRGFVFGDGVYEVIVSYHGNLFLLDEHVDRLRRSLKFIRMEYVDVDAIVQQIHTVFAAAEIPRAKVYVQVTRGVAPRNHQFPVPAPKPTVVVTVRDFPPLPEPLFTDGISCLTRPDTRWGRVDIKTINLLPNCLAKQEAIENNCLEAIFVSAEGKVREASAANLFLVKNETIITHPANELILCGITRNALLELAERAGYAVEERSPDVEELLLADEVFLSGTTAEVLPVVRVDDQPIGQGRPGPVSLKLLGMFREWIAGK
jgi:D-alanine transaminase